MEIAPDWKGRGEDSYVIAAPVQIGNTAYVCEVVVMKGETRTGFYLHEVQTKEKLLDVFKTGVVTSTSGASKSILLDVWQRVKQIEENCSKVVDENGEPLVVYHGSPNFGFTVFDKSRKGERDRGDFGKGFYFTPNRRYAASYAQVDVKEKSRIPEWSRALVTPLDSRNAAEEIKADFPEFVNTNLGNNTIAMTREAEDALTILRKRETEREGERLIREWQFQLARPRGARLDR